MKWIKLYEDFDYPIWVDITRDEYDDIPKENFIPFKDYVAKRIADRLPKIFAHNDFLYKVKPDEFIILERKHIPFIINIKLIVDDFFIVKITSLLETSVILRYKCDDLSGLFSFLKNLSGKYLNKSQELIMKKGIIEFGKLPFISWSYADSSKPEFSYKEEQLKKLISKLDLPGFEISEKFWLNDYTFNVSFSPWSKLKIDLRYYGNYNCFQVMLSKLGEDIDEKNYKCFGEQGLYLLLTKITDTELDKLRL